MFTRETFASMRASLDLGRSPVCSYDAQFNVFSARLAMVFPIHYYLNDKHKDSVNLAITLKAIPNEHVATSIVKSFD
jgi:hypothetical protein